MADLGSITINTNGEWVDLAEAMNISFETDKKYTIQVLNGGYFCEKANKPEKGGFLYTSTRPFGFTYRGDKLWFKNISVNATINIGD